MPMDRDTVRKLTKLLSKLDSFMKDIKPLRDKLSRSLARHKRGR